MYGPVRTVVWQGSAGDRRPYADQTAFPEKWIPGQGRVVALLRKPHFKTAEEGTAGITSEWRVNLQNMLGRQVDRLVQTDFTFADLFDLRWDRQGISLMTDSQDRWTRAVR